MEGKFLTIKQAASLLGVSPLTLRNWDKKGRLVAYRHPLNNYRVYKREDIDKLLEHFESAPASTAKAEEPTAILSSATSETTSAVVEIARFVPKTAPQPKKTQQGPRKLTINLIEE